MKKRIGILTVLIAVCAACVILSAGCSQAQQPQLGFTEGRIKSIAASVLGLISVVIGGLALARSTRSMGTGKERTGAILALGMGLIGMILGVVHLGSFTGGFGTGSGRAGAIAALVLGLIGTSLGGLALARSKRSRSTD